jgi:hypothetical protein
MEVTMLTQAIRHALLFVALAALPGFVAAAGSQAGDNGRQPIGADSDSPRQAIPDATTNDAAVDYGTTYYGATTAYQRALYYCAQKPPELQSLCREAADARYGYPGYGDRNGLTEQVPAYVTYRHDPSATY